MALWTCWIKLNGNEVRLDGLLNLPSSMVSIPQVVEGWVVLRIKSNGFQIELNGFHVVIFIAVGITQVVEALNFLRIEL